MTEEDPSFTCFLRLHASICTLRVSVGSCVKNGSGEYYAKYSAAYHWPADLFICQKAVSVSSQHLKHNEISASIPAGGLTCARRRLMTSSSFSDISSFDTSSLDRLAISCAILVSHSCRFRGTENKQHMRRFLEVWHDKQWGVNYIL